MENQVSLMEYLQNGLPVIPLVPPAKTGRNTTNQAYSYQNITYIGVWHQFSLDNILNRYNHILTATTLPSDPFTGSPPPPVNSQNLLLGRIAEMIIPRVRRALRTGFNQLHSNNQLDEFTPLGFDVGEAATTPSGFKPDIAYYELPCGSGPNRAPGDVKPSWKWRTTMAMGSPTERREFKQVLSEVNWYMRQQNSRYGFVVTDLEMVAIRRLDDNGRLELSTPIPWGTAGGAQPHLTILLALWYLGMLAAQNQGPDRWWMQ